MTGLAVTTAKRGVAMGYLVVEIELVVVVDVGDSDVDDRRLLGV
jgi:hypothetical protein